MYSCYVFILAVEMAFTMALIEHLKRSLFLMQKGEPVTNLIHEGF